MDLKTVKKASEIVLDGITVEATREDSNIVALKLTDAKGNALHIKHNTWSSSLNIFVPAPRPTVTRYRIQGALKGIKFSEDFESEHEASMRRIDLGLTDDECPVAKVEVPEVP